MSSRPARLRILERRAVRDVKIPASADDPEMLNGWRMIPVRPTNDPNWFILDSSSDKKTVWGRWVFAEGRG
jgi:hypothetical protein